jgi:hypothetical protein
MEKEKNGYLSLKGDVVNIGGWIFMILSWSFIIALNVFCFSRVFGSRHGKM